MAEKKTPFTVLAPMAGFTDAPFRLLCSRHGADYAVSEMVSAAAMVYRDRKTALLADVQDEEGPCAIQLFGHDPDQIAKSAEMLCSGSYEGASGGRTPAAIDINMGCPVKKIVSSGDGSALMKNPGLAASIVAAAVKVCSKYGVPVTVKMRSGFSRSDKNAPDIALRCVEAGAAAICVHGRSREDMYSPGVDEETIARVRLALPENIPVVANGDVKSGEDAVRLLEHTGCDGVMVGRAALGNPWIFEEIKCAFLKKSFSGPTAAQRCDAALWLLGQIVARNGESAGVRASRGRLSHFIRGMRGGAAARERLNCAVTVCQAEDIIRELFEKNAN